MWTVLWFSIAADSPEMHPWISVEEYEYIMDSRPAEHNEKRPPVRPIGYSRTTFVGGVETRPGSMTWNRGR